MKNHLNKAYSLVELSVSIAVIAILAVGFLGDYTKKTEAKRYKITNDRIKFIEKSLKDFIDQHYYLPCPALGNTTESSSSSNMFGYSLSYTSPNCNNIANYVGMIPVRTLNIPDDYAYDGWGRKFSYSIAQGLGSESDLMTGQYKGNINIIDLQGISKTDINRAYPNNYGAAYVIVSFGQNGLGAWSKDSINSPILPSTSSREYQNASYLTNNLSSSKFIQNETNYIFGQIVSYKTLQNIFSIKYQRSPIRIPNNTCSNASTILNDPSKQYNNTSSDSDEAKENAESIYLAASKIQSLCNNQPITSINSSSSCNFKPNSLSNLRLWLDANDSNGNGNILNDGNSIGTWIDKSGDNRNASVSAGTPKYASTSSNNSIFQKGSIYFNGSSSYNVNLSFLANSDYTVFAVYSSSIYNNNTVSPFNTNNNKQSWVMYAGPNGAGINQAFQLGPKMIGNVFTQYLGHNQNDTSVSVTEQPLTNVINQQLPYMVMGTFNQLNATRTLLVRSNNGFAARSDYVGGITGNPLTTASNGSIASCSYLSSSSCKGYSGYIAEIIFYNRTLTIDEQKQVEGYLLRKWFSGECL